MDLYRCLPDPDPDHKIFLAAVTDIDTSFLNLKTDVNVPLVSNKQKIKKYTWFFPYPWKPQMKMFNKQ